MISKCLGQSLFPFLLRTQLEAEVKHPFQTCEFMVLELYLRMLNGPQSRTQSFRLPILEVSKGVVYLRSTLPAMQICNFLFCW